MPPPADSSDFILMLGGLDPSMLVYISTQIEVFSSGTSLSHCSVLCCVSILDVFFPLLPKSCVSEVH